MNSRQVGKTDRILCFHCIYRWRHIILHIVVCVSVWKIECIYWLRARVSHIHWRAFDMLLLCTWWSRRCYICICRQMKYECAFCWSQCFAAVIVAAATAVIAWMGRYIWLVKMKKKEKNKAVNVSLVIQHNTDTMHGYLFIENFITWSPIQFFFSWVYFFMKLLIESNRMRVRRWQRQFTWYHLQCNSSSRIIIESVALERVLLLFHLIFWFLFRLLLWHAFNHLHSVIIPSIASHTNGECKLNV